MGTIKPTLYLLDYWLLFGSVPEQLPPFVPPVNAAVAGRYWTTLCSESGAAYSSKTGY